MTYFLFLILFLVLPTLPLAWTLRRWLTRDRLLMLALLSLMALLYTTPWDNYLVATQVWSYDPQLVTGLTVGWVPIEEYGFFILQPLLTGLWVLFLHRRSPARALETDWPELRQATVLLGGLFWLCSLPLLLSGWAPGTYLALELAWALPPLLLQLGFGADVLWHHGRLVALALVPATVYLATADALAIEAGIWSINAEQSLPIYLGGILPLEEFVFFFLTNTLIVFAMVLALTPQSKQRLASLFRQWDMESIS